MSKGIKGTHIQILAVILNKCVFFKKLYILPNQETLLMWVNQGTKIDRCIRMLNYQLRRLEDEGLLKRIRRCHNDKILGHVFESTIYEITKIGLIALERIGIEAFKIVKKIQKTIRGLKKKPPREGTREGKKSGLTSIGEAVKDFMKQLKLI